MPGSTFPDFQIIGTITRIEPIALGRGVRDRKRLERAYGKGRWRKLKGVASVHLADGSMHTAEVHWYEPHGIGQREFKIKLPLLD